MTQSLVDKSLKLKKALSKPLKTIVGAVGQKIDESDHKFMNPEFLLDMAERHWDLTTARAKDTVQISGYVTAIGEKSGSTTIIDVVCDDYAFLVDSVAAEINRHDMLIDFLVHHNFYVQRDKSGKPTDITPESTEGYELQGHLHFHLHGFVHQKQLDELLERLHIVVQNIELTNRDWLPMLSELEHARIELAEACIKLSAKEIEKYCAFLEYLHDNNFTLLGYKEYEFLGNGKNRSAKNIQGLGLFSKDVKPAFIDEEEEGFPHNIQGVDLPVVSVSKTRTLSTVHRPVSMDVVAVKVFDKSGNVKGEKLFLGLFTSVTYSRSVDDIPLLREKVREVIDYSEFQPYSHDRKALRHILEKYPRDELFQIPAKDLFQTAKEMLRLQERQRITLFMRKDVFEKYIFCLIYVPRDRFGTALRERMGRILEEKTGGTITSLTTGLDDSVFARVMFVIHTDPQKPVKYKSSAIEKLLQEAGQTWPESLQIALAEELEDDSLIQDLHVRYRSAFPVSYRYDYSAKQAVFDIEKLEQVRKSGTLALDLYRPGEVDNKFLRLKVYNQGAPITLADVLPKLNDMGLRAISERPYEISPMGEAAHSVWIHDFLLEVPADLEIKDVSQIKDVFEEAFLNIWYGKCNSDYLNQLVIKAGMPWRDVFILRAYVRYMKQIRYPFGRLYIEKALTDHYDISALLVDYFKSLFNPKTTKNPKRIQTSIFKALDDVSSLDFDRILRSIYTFIEYTLRTNFYQKGQIDDHKPYISLKLDCKQISDIPEPKPYREIFVFGPDIEGVHLRGGPIARGGLRWSDRHEDYRTEVLGLMKAQMVKNAVIVPMGSKGGFVVKKKTTTRDEFREAGIECYKLFIRGLLDITDNQKGTKIIPPKNVVRRDGDDPYLVVAADKGTATFSDIANGLSEEYDFWLGDAFASGGSAGYDHKKMGITARGGWESVKYHFRHMGIDVQTTNFDVVGVGDMGGDVFGNGMLLSKHICLIGAFNHLHIFCDPNPDPEKTWKERERLFNNVMGWDQYDEKLLSKGGRIFLRSEKSLKLTPEIKERFDITKDKVSPDELMQAMLKARTDLLWFGGIGTYIKSSDEEHADAGDKANDNLRVDGVEVRAKVIGEGANLGTTQLGRIEMESAGVRLNTDFIDNSGGVDSSDHEVNIKILLSDVMSDKSNDLDLKKRNKLLEEMTDEVANHVLRNNYQQNQALSLVHRNAPAMLLAHEDLIRDLEQENDLNRENEFLPDSEELEERLRQGQGLTRPELAVLLSYAKIDFTQRLTNSAVPESSDMMRWLVSYFPKVLQDRYSKHIKNHKLRCEIVATAMANSIINRMGPTFLKSCAKETGASADEIAKAYMIARQVFGFKKIWNELEAMPVDVPRTVVMDCMQDIAELCTYVVKWFVVHLPSPLSISNVVELFQDGVQRMFAAMPASLSDDQKETFEMRVSLLESENLPRDMAVWITSLGYMRSALGLISLSQNIHVDPKAVSNVFHDVGAKLRLDWLRREISYMPMDDYWHKKAVGGLMTYLDVAQRDLTRDILSMMYDAKGKQKSKDFASSYQVWEAQHCVSIKRLASSMREIEHTGHVEFPMLMLVEQNLRDLLGRCSVSLAA